MSKTEREERGGTSLRYTGEKKKPAGTILVILQRL